MTLTITKKRTYSPIGCNIPKRNNDDASQVETFESDLMPNEPQERNTPNTKPTNTNVEEFEVNRVHIDSNE